MPRKNSIKNQSTTLSKNVKQSSESPNWRIKIQETRLISQVSTILLQRQTQYWAPLLKGTLKFSTLTPPLFLQILQKTRTSPQISLDFFNWAKKSLRFQPDLRTQCKLTHLLFESGVSRLAKPILDSIIQAYPSKEIVNSFCKVVNFDTCSPVLTSVLEAYCNRGLYLDALEVYLKAIGLGNGTVSVHVCNALLNLLQDKNEIRLAWCLYSSMVRNGVLVNQYTWSVIGRILCTDNKFERIGRILDMGINSSLLYELMIENHSERGDFDAAFGYLAKMYDKKCDPSFRIYSSILNGACKCGDTIVTDGVMRTMIEKGYIPKGVSSEYDPIIQKLSDLGKTYAACLFLGRACAKNVDLQDATYGCILVALSKNGRMKDAIDIYDIVSERKMIVGDSCYNAFVNGLCKEKPSQQVYALLKDLIGKGIVPGVAEVSEYLKAQCENHRWEEAEVLLSLILDNGLMPDPSSCSPLVKFHCSTRQIDSAMKLHGKMKMLRGTFDVEACNVLLNKLFKQSRVKEALEMFDDMRVQEVHNSESFVIMIRELCRVKEMRKAMKLHDQMLGLGLKPNVKIYKRLISGFG